MPSTSSTARRPTPRALGALLPFLRPYRWPIVAALGFLLLAAAATLAFPLALKFVIDRGLPYAGQGTMLRAHFIVLFIVAVAVGVFSAARYYMMSWLGERGAGWANA